MVQPNRIPRYPQVRCLTQLLHFCSTNSPVTEETSAVLLGVLRGLRLWELQRKRQKLPDPGEDREQNPGLGGSELSDLAPAFRGWWKGPVQHEQQKSAHVKHWFLRVVSGVNSLHAHRMTDTENYRQMTIDHEKQWQMRIWFLSQHAPFPNGLLKDGLHHLMAMMAMMAVWSRRILDVGYGALGCASHEVRVFVNNSPHVTATYSIWKNRCNAKVIDRVFLQIGCISIHGGEIYPLSTLPFLADQLPWGCPAGCVRILEHPGEN